jgi:hypothetical protein
MKSTYIESFIIISAVALATGCSAAQQSEQVDDESSGDENVISSLEQAIGQAGCATATPNAAATLTFANSEAFLSRVVSGGAYQSTSAGCPNADILGLKATTVRGGTLTVGLSVKFSSPGLTLAQQKAECALTSFKISHFKNGVNRFTTVGTPGAGFAALQTVEAGVPIVNAGRCTNGVFVNWSVPRAGSPILPDESRTSSASGKTIFIRSGMPVAADKGTFVIEAKDRTGALVGYDFRVDP